MVCNFSIESLQKEPIKIDPNQDHSTIDLIGRQFVVERSKTRIVDYMMESMRHIELITPAASSTEKYTGASSSNSSMLPRKSSDKGTRGGPAGPPVPKPSAGA